MVFLGGDFIFPLGEASAYMLFYDIKDVNYYWLKHIISVLDGSMYIIFEELSVCALNIQNKQQNRTLLAFYQPGTCILRMDTSCRLN